MLSNFNIITLNSLIKKNLIKTENVIIDSKSGYSGAGRGFIKNIKIRTYMSL